ncbi:MAG: hypothetical protein LBQ93_01700 [Treponema sp.]|jgi:hypothetical protein|nr:hypothetical protein [Treponema sp.]
MRRTILITCILILSLACESKRKDKAVGSGIFELANTEHITPIVSQIIETKETVNIYNTPHDTDFDEESHRYTANDEEIYTFDRIKDEFNEAFKDLLTPIGTYFWDEFEDLEAQYGLTKDESKLLGQWLNVTFMANNFNYYCFYPNKLFLLKFQASNYQYIPLFTSTNLYFDKAVGTWEIVNGIVQFTIHAIIIVDTTSSLENYPFKKNVLFVDRPYTVDFVNIDDIGEEGFTKRPINDVIFSNELQQMVRIINPDRINNLYVRKVYSIFLITNSGEPEKHYTYFSIVREMAQENLSGLDIATNSELIERYIFNLRLY